MFFAWTAVQTRSEPGPWGSGLGSPGGWTEPGGAGSGSAKNGQTWTKPDRGQSNQIGRIGLLAFWT